MIEILYMYLLMIFISMMIIAPFMDMEANLNKTNYNILEILFTILILPFVIIVPIIIIMKDDIVKYFKNKKKARINKMDYKVEFMLNGEVKEDIVCLDDFNNLGADFLEDFAKDQLIEKYESKNIKIIHMETLIDYNVNVYDL